MSAISRFSVFTSLRYKITLQQHLFDSSVSGPNSEGPLYNERLELNPLRPHMVKTKVVLNLGWS